MLNVHHLSVTLDAVPLLHDISFRCLPGSINAIIGPNGAGKSTLLAAIAADIPLWGGRVEINGENVQKMSASQLAARRSVMTQDSVLRFPYSVREVVAMGCALRPFSPGEDEGRIAAAMEAMEITAMAQRNAMLLSGGEQARTTFARVLVQQGPVMLLDEPTSTLDLRHQERLLQCARNWAKKGGCVVIVLHDLNLASAWSDTLLLMKEGKLIMQGAPQQVLCKSVIEQAYQQKVCILQHPERKCPLVVTA